MADDNDTVIAPGNIRVRGIRSAVLTGDFIARIERMFQRMAGRGSSPIAFDAGREMGLRLVTEGLEASLDEAGSFLSETNVGTLTVVSLDTGHKGGILRVEDSFFAVSFLEHAGESQRPVCDYLRGLFAGVFEGHYHERFLCLERRCAARGESACEFSIYPSHPV
ncbi:MAG: hypothetical protein QF415_06680 [Candidatus Undinarchaeales archaeon]|nr:hypothetical protein [Candidatus Undinarchaeales archaeon]MDP7492671.1 hypothetical protein [Candidatus Undinarchaeales archaeon]